MSMPKGEKVSNAEQACSPVQCRQNYAGQQTASSSACHDISAWLCQQLPPWLPWMTHTHVAAAAGSADRASGGPTCSTLSRTMWSLRSVADHLAYHPALAASAMPAHDILLPDSCRVHFRHLHEWLHDYISANALPSCSCSKILPLQTGGEHPSGEEHTFWQPMTPAQSAWVGQSLHGGFS